MRTYSVKMISVMTFSDQVRNAIKSSGMTRYMIAKESGLTSGALSRFMAGDRDMNLRTLDKLASVIGVRLVIDRPKRRRKRR